MPWDDAKATLNRTRRDCVPFSHKHGPYLITFPRPKKPYGRALLGTYFHQPKLISCAWRNGRMVVCKVAWWCGASTFNFVLLDEPMGPLFNCKVCEVLRKGRGS